MGERFRLSLSLTLALFGAALLPGVASACSMPAGWTPQRAFAEAALVFHGLVTATELSSTEVEGLPADVGDGRILVNVHYETIEVFKGSPEADGAISTTTLIMGGCGVPVLAGQHFLFYVNGIDETTRKDMPELAGQTQGMISIYDTQMLPPDPKMLDEALADVRALAKKH